MELEGGEADCKKAIELNPGSATISMQCNSQLGRTDQAIEEIWPHRNTIRCDHSRRASRILLWVDDFGIRLFNAKALELEANFAPVYSVLAQAYAFQQQYPEALEAAKKYVDLTGGGDQERLELAYAQAVAGKKVEAQQIVSEVEQRGENFSQCDMAAICVALNDQKGACPGSNAPLSGTRSTSFGCALIRGLTGSKQEAFAT
jgi:hypothetical protein